MNSNPEPASAEIEPIRRIDIQAKLTYLGPEFERAEGWVCEVTVPLGEDGDYSPLWQGWGPDPLSAALDAAEVCAARSLMLQGITITGLNRRGYPDLTYQPGAEAEADV